MRKVAVGLTRRSLAARWMHGMTSELSPGVQVMPTRIKSGKATSLHRGGIAHLVKAAVLVADDDAAVLAARWWCGGGSADAVPVVGDTDHAACHNCREAQGLPDGPMVYRCYDEDDVLIYVGSTKDVAQRIRSHRAGTSWWDRVARIVPEPHHTVRSARVAEALTIADEKPVYNRDNVPPHLRVRHAP